MLAQTDSKSGPKYTTTATSRWRQIPVLMSGVINLVMNPLISWFIQ